DERHARRRVPHPQRLARGGDDLGVAQAQLGLEELLGVDVDLDALPPRLVAVQRDRQRVRAGRDRHDRRDESDHLAVHGHRRPGRARATRDGGGGGGRGVLAARGGGRAVRRDDDLPPLWTAPRGAQLQRVAAGGEGQGRRRRGIGGSGIAVGAIDADLGGRRPGGPPPPPHPRQRRGGAGPPPPPGPPPPAPPPPPP